jgi:hypothetical protein
MGMNPRPWIDQKPPDDVPLDVWFAFLAQTYTAARSDITSVDVRGWLEQREALGLSQGRAVSR